jgi:hypothetical protein
MRYMTHANPKPSTSSMITVTTVRMAVVENEDHQIGSLSTVV